MQLNCVGQRRGRIPNSKPPEIDNDPLKSVLPDTINDFRFLVYRMDETEVQFAMTALKLIVLLTTHFSKK